jgi:nucleoid-associated protein YgaU
MRASARVKRWAIIGATAAALAAVPVAARPEREEERPPLAVVVHHGDSLWTLARERGDPRRDVREVVWEMLRMNEVDPGQLQPGMVILIPASALQRSEECPGRRSGGRPK